MNEDCVPSGCGCSCHRFPGTKHLIPCCDQVEITPDPEWLDLVEILPEEEV